jgi:hypothetical protein
LLHDAAHSVAAAVLWRKHQRLADRASSETKGPTRNSPIMILAITGQWVGEVTLVLCLFGAACIGLAVSAGDPGKGVAPRTAEQKAPERQMRDDEGRRSERDW